MFVLKAAVRACAEGGPQARLRFARETKSNILYGIYAGDYDAARESGPKRYGGQKHGVSFTGGAGI